MIKDYFFFKGNSIRKILEKNPEQAGVIPGFEVEENDEGELEYKTKVRIKDGLAKINSRLQNIAQEGDISLQMDEQNRIKRRYEINLGIWLRSPIGYYLLRSFNCFFCKDKRYIENKRKEVIIE
ncbi:MAG: hypothetical protein AABX30_01715 [Nanoarchaeota archaeon]